VEPSLSVAPTVPETPPPWQLPQGKHSERDAQERRSGYDRPELCWAARMSIIDPPSGFCPGIYCQFNDHGPWNSETNSAIISQAGDGDDLLRLRGQRPVGEDSLAEGIECCFDVGSEGSSFLRKPNGCVESRGHRATHQGLPTPTAG
jgi:hypothetical protein